MVATLIPFDESLSAWERALYAFLAEKERRSGSRRTVEGYSRMLQHFFGAVGKQPERVTSPEVFAFAHGVGLSGREPSAVTIGARMACVSSFYRFLIRMGLVASNPCDQLERPRVSPSPPRGLTENRAEACLGALWKTCKRLSVGFRPEPSSARCPTASSQTCLPERCDLWLQGSSLTTLVAVDPLPTSTKGLSSARP